MSIVWVLIKYALQQTLCPFCHTPSMCWTQSRHHLGMSSKCVSVYSNVALKLSCTVHSIQFACTRHKLLQYNYHYVHNCFIIHNICKFWLWKTMQPQALADNVGPFLKNILMCRTIFSVNYISSQVRHNISASDSDNVYNVLL